MLVICLLKATCGLRVSTSVPFIIIDPQRIREGYSRVHQVSPLPMGVRPSGEPFCLSVCVSLTTLEATLIYSAKNGHQ